MDWYWLGELLELLSVRLHISQYTLVLILLYIQVPHEIQQQMSSEMVPVLGNMIPTFHTYITAWCALKTQKPHLQPFIDEGLKWVTQYYEKLQRNSTYTIAMRMYLGLLTNMSPPDETYLSSIEPCKKTRGHKR